MSETFVEAPLIERHMANRVCAFAVGRTYLAEVGCALMQTSGYQRLGRCVATNVNAGTRRCHVCETVKPLDAFAHDRTKSCNRAHTCKECKRAYYREGPDNRTGGMQRLRAKLRAARTVTELAPAA